MLEKDTIPKTGSWLDRWAAVFLKLSAWAACFMFSINIIDVVFGVVARYIFHSSVIWTEELARFSMIWMVMLGALGAAVNNEHMVINLVVPRLKNKAIRRFFEGIRFLLTIALFSLMIYLGTINAIQLWDTKTLALNLRKTYAVMAVPVGFALLILGIIHMQLRRREN